MVVVIKSCENDVTTGNGILVPDELASSEVSSSGAHTVSQKKECCLVRRRLSPRLQNLPDHKKVYYGSDRKKTSKSGSGIGVGNGNVNGNGNSSVQKRTKLNPLMQQQALVDHEVGEGYLNNTCSSLSSGCGETFVEGGDDNVSNSTSNGGFFLFDELNNRCKKVDYNNVGTAKFSRTKNGNAPDVNVKSSLKQPDRKAPSKADKYCAEKRIAGFTVYKCPLKRLKGQAKMNADKVHFARGKLPKVSSGYPSLVCKDVSNGQENISIPVTNEYDDPPVAPAGFTYIQSIQVANNVKVPSNVHGCQCKGSCTNTRTCSCARLNGSEFPYVRKGGGRLIEPRDVVFECGLRCGCGPDCGNRVSQKGLKYQLEVYRTPNKGWAVRSWDFVPSGAPVCEYVGVLRRSDELENVAENDYIFDVDCWQTMNGVEGRERRLRDVSLPTSTSDLKGDDDETMESVPEFCIDAGSFGNVARFINHSCEPNLFVQCVLSSHLDIRLARVVLFAADDIAPYQELTYDYGYKIDSVIGPDGQIKQLPCYCGAADCRKRLY